MQPSPCCSARLPLHISTDAPPWPLQCHPSPSPAAHAPLQCQLDNCEAPLEGCSGCSQCASGYTLPAGSSKCEQCQTPASTCEKFKPNSCSECSTCASGYTLNEATSACDKVSRSLQLFTAVMPAGSLRQAQGCTEFCRPPELQPPVCAAAQYAAT